MQEYFGQGFGCIIDSVVDHNNISKTNPLAVSSYIIRIKPSQKRFD